MPRHRPSCCPSSHPSNGLGSHPRGRAPDQPARRRWLLAAALAAGGSAPPQAAPGDARRWPRGPLRIWLVYPPGGASDAVLRALADPLAAVLGVPVVLEYRPGAAGSLGLQALADAPADDHTLAFAATTPLTLVPLLRAVRYRPLLDIVPVAAVMVTPALLVATPAFAGAGIDDLARLACAAPGRLRWATTGAGTTGHLVLAQWQLASGCSVTHVPYKGGGQQLADALAGHVELLSTNVAAAQRQHIAAGRLKALAVGAPQRLPSLPQVPTWAELGVPAANLASVFGLMAPASLPEPARRRLNQAVNQVLQTPALQAVLAEADNLSAAGSPEAFVARVQAERLQHQALLARAPITLE